MGLLGVRGPTWAIPAAATVGVQATMLAMLAGQLTGALLLDVFVQRTVRLEAGLSEGEHGGA